ncbi:MAG: hypothetical protein ACE5JG_12175, partial [Planctomycetota bacterium]
MATRALSRSTRAPAKQIRSFVVHPSLKGLNTRFGATILPPEWLTIARNVDYRQTGVREKRGGAVKHTTTAVTPTGNDDISALYDAHRGEALSSTQRLVCYAGDSLFQKTAAATAFTSLKTGLEQNKVSWFITFDGLLIWASNSNTDVPQEWDFTGAIANLQGTPPNFAFGAVHKARLFVAGVNTNPSRLYWCASDDPQDWTTPSNAGNQDIDHGDGDTLMGMASFRRADNDALYLFKGPHKGLIERFTGSGPSDFARQVVMRGLP